MSSLWIVNASPVITLAKVGQHELLGKLTDSLLLPDAVAGEILAGPITDPARFDRIGLGFTGLTCFYSRRASGMGPRRR